MTYQILRYVPHERASAYEAVGWRAVGNRGTIGNLNGSLGSHGYWSCLMRWEGEGEPVEPEETQ